MESTSSSYDNTFYCPACKREYPLSSKKYHISICKGLKSVQSDNNTIKENCGVNECIDIHEEEKESDSLPQPPILKEEKDFEELQLVLDQISQEKELEEDKKKGISSKIKGCGENIVKVACMAKAGVGVGILGLGYLLDNGMNILVRQVDGRDTPEEERELPFVVPKEMGKKREENKFNLLPVTEINNEDNLPKVDCTICLAGFYVKEKVTSLPCLHIFHNECIKEWLKEHNVCPVCKLQLNNENLGLE